jgi:arylsulfatase A-like enzyme
LKAIVLTFDRLPSHLLGCYGNEWIETPGFDRLAALGGVFDQHFAEVPGPVGPNHSWWTGQFEFFSDPECDGHDDDATAQNWIQKLVQGGVKCRLLAENTEGLPTELFYSSEAVGGVTGLNAAHDDVPIARLVQRGIEILENGGSEAESPDGESQPELIWLHSQGVPSPWLPPRLFAELYLDELEEIVDGESGSEIAGNLVSQFEHDPDLVRLLLSDWRRDAEVADDFEDVVTPSESEPDDIDSPELERQISRLVFAGYVSMIDRWLLKLLEAVESSDEQILLVVSANQGHSFGETADLLPGAVGQTSTITDGVDSPLDSLQSGTLNDTLLRTPLLIAEFSNPSGDQVFGSRHTALVQPVDMAATLETWLSDAAGRNAEGGVASAGQSLLKALFGDTPDGRSLAFHLGPDGQLGVRNRHWALVTSADTLNQVEEADPDVLLFTKPDDQWDIHNVASQYGDEVETLLGKLRARCAARSAAR